MSESVLCVKIIKRKDWRKFVKKVRRKKIRTKQALERQRKEIEIQSSPTYLTNLAKERLLEDYELEQEERYREVRHQQWLKEEERLCHIWREKEEIRLKQNLEKQEKQKRIKEEWEAAKRRKEEKEKEEAKKREEAQSKIDYFINKGGDIPDELRVLNETNPNREPCPFFSKVAACRFGPSCSRNHVLPSISKVLLIPGFYSHFTLHQNRSAEYDTDVGLEFEENETYRDFRDFFQDVVSELRQWPGLQIVQVCRNSESHLRGNLYAQYETERSALAAYRGLHARWYGGRQLTVHFAKIPDWGAAVCGDFRRGRCPKGAECNFLHVFRNPRGELQPATRRENSISTPRSARSWRWSESPEPERRTNRESSNDRSSEVHRRDRGRRSRDRHKSEQLVDRESENDRKRRRRRRSRSSSPSAQRKKSSRSSSKKQSRSPLCDNSKNQ